MALDPSSIAAVPSAQVPKNLFSAELNEDLKTRYEALKKSTRAHELGVDGEFIQYTQTVDRILADRLNRKFPQARSIAKRGELDAVYVIGSRFNSVLSTPPTTERVLPVEPPATKGAQKDYLLYPSAEEILTELLPSYVRNAVYRALVETAAAEQAARRTAMKNATDNAGEMLTLLRRTYNRARQAQITQEIAEIVGGAAALQG